LLLPIQEQQDKKFNKSSAKFFHGMPLDVAAGKSTGTEGICDQQSRWTTSHLHNGPWRGLLQRRLK